jgi:hypothetical protein
MINKRKELFRNIFAYTKITNLYALTTTKRFEGFDFT